MSQNLSKYLPKLSKFLSKLSQLFSKLSKSYQISFNIIKIYQNKLSQLSNSSISSCYKSRILSKYGFDRFDNILINVMSQKLSKHLSKLSKVLSKLSKLLSKLSKCYQILINIIKIYQNTLSKLSHSLEISNL